MKDFRCSCIGCGKTPEFGKAEIWVEAEKGMLCESCWQAVVREGRHDKETVIPPDSEFCCFCALCKRIPPDREYKIWIETDKGCICEKCFRETVGVLISQKTGFSSGEKKIKAPIDVQFGCCQLNKKLLIKSLDNLHAGESLEIIAENSDVIKEIVKKYAEAGNCTITDIKDENGTCLITIRKQ